MVAVRVGGGRLLGFALFSQGLPLGYGISPAVNLVKEDLSKRLTEIQVQGYLF